MEEVNSKSSVNLYKTGYRNLVPKCRKYEGNGRIKEMPDAKETSCKSCDGSGERLTESGQALYKLGRFLKGKGLLS